MAVNGLAHLSLGDLGEFRLVDDALEEVGDGESSPSVAALWILAPSFSGLTAPHFKSN